MKRLSILNALLVINLATGTPAALGHAGHGDEFQAEGGVNRVEVNAQTDPLLGIQVSPIESAPDGSGTVMIPVSALVEDNGRQLVFVQYENFYEPVPVTTGTTQGELIEVTEGLSTGEELVTQGSLSLYAESRKTPTAETDEITSTADTHAHADAQGIPHSHDAAGNLVEGGGSETASDVLAAEAEQDGGISKLMLAAAAVGAGLIIAAIAIVTARSKKTSASEGSYSTKNEGF